MTEFKRFARKVADAFLSHLVAVISAAVGVLLLAGWGRLVQAWAWPVAILIPLIGLTSFTWLVVGLERVVAFFKKPIVSTTQTQSPPVFPAEVGRMLKPTRASKFAIRHRIELRRMAETLSGEIRKSIETCRIEPSTLAQALRRAAHIAYDVPATAIDIYERLYKTRVQHVYSDPEFDRTSLDSRSVRHASLPLERALYTFGGNRNAPDDPTTMNELIAIAVELELHASKLPIAVPLSGEKNDHA